MLEKNLKNILPHQLPQYTQKFTDFNAMYQDYNDESRRCFLISEKKNDNAECRTLDRFINIPLLLTPR